MRTENKSEERDSVLEKRPRRETKKAETSDSAGQRRGSLPRSLLSGGLTDVAMAMASGSRAAGSRPGCFADFSSGGPAPWRRPPALAPESWPPQRLEEEKENPQNSPNGRQLGRAGGGAAGRAGASLRDLIQRRALGPRGLPGAAGLARPPEPPVLGRGDTPGPQGPAPSQGRGRRGGRAEGLDGACPGRSG